MASAIGPMNRSRYTVKNDNVFRHAKLQVSAYRLKPLEAKRAESFNFLVKGNVPQNGNWHIDLDVALDTFDG